MIHSTTRASRLFQNRLEGSFWRSVYATHGTVLPIVAWRMLCFATWAVMVDLFHHYVYQLPKWSLTPTEIFGATIGVILVFRTNAGYDRWWEARKIWGGIVNQSRNLVIAAIEYGPKDHKWQKDLTELAIMLPYSIKSHLRNELGPDDMDPYKVSQSIARLIAQAQNSSHLSGMAFLKIEEERAKLIDYLGMCERILKTPMPYSYAVEVRRLLFAFLALAPLATVGSAGIHMPVVILLGAHPLLSLDQIGRELQQPFCKSSVSHLPLDDICHTIEKNLTELLANAPAMN